MRAENAVLTGYAGAAYILNPMITVVSQSWSLLYVRGGMELEFVFLEARDFSPVNPMHQLDSRQNEAAKNRTASSRKQPRLTMQALSTCRQVRPHEIRVA